MATIIKSVEIRGFRSIVKSGRIPLLSSNALLGKNSCGKSNILRALNWFFNDEVEDKVPLNLLNDASYRVNKKKEILVSVEFDPSHFANMRKSLRDKWNPGKPFIISKKANYRENIQINEFSITPNEEEEFPDEFNDEQRIDWIKTYISLIRFRYIAANREPSMQVRELMIEASRFIEPAIKQRLTAAQNKTIKTSGSRPLVDSSIFRDLTQSINNVSNNVFKEVKKIASRELVNVSDVNPGQPKNLLSWIRELGFQFTTNCGAIVDVKDQGTGAQSFLFFTLLKFVSERTRMYKFGWRQAEIWGIEEPEIFLHNDLAETCAALIADVSNSNLASSAPVQSIITTHSVPFYQKMDNQIFLRIGKTGFTTVDNGSNNDMAPVIEGVIPFHHPLFQNVSKTLIIVEGKTDKNIFTQLAGFLKKPHFLIQCVSDLTGRPEGDNSDKQMKNYIQNNAAALGLRSLKGGLTIIFDGNVNNDEIGKIKKTIESAIKSFASPIKSSLSVIGLKQFKGNPELDATFTGIERFFPTLIAKASFKEVQISIGNYRDGLKKVYSVPNTFLPKFNKTIKPLMSKNFLDSIDEHKFEFLSEVLL